MRFSTKSAMILLGAGWLAGCGGAAKESSPPPAESSAPAPAGSAAVAARWAAMPLAEKARWLSRPDGGGSAGVAQLLDEERAWVCLADAEKLDADPVVASRLAEARARILADEVVRRAVVARLLTEAEVVDHYQKNQSSFFVPEEIRVSHILASPRKEPSLANSGGDDAVGDAAAKAKIEKLAAEKLSPSAFAARAREVSEDGTAIAGGDLGWFGRGAMSKPFEEAAFAASPGVVTGPVKSEFGWHLVLVTGKRGGKFLSLDEVRRDVEDRLLSGRAADVQKVQQEIVAKLPKACG